MEKQIFQPAGESIRPAIPRRLWGRHIMYIASPKSPWLEGRLNSWNIQVKKIRKYIEDNQPTGCGWPGNIRELEQCVRRILLNNNYQWQKLKTKTAIERFIHEIETGELSGSQLLSHYCSHLYRQLGTYEAISQRTELDRRTVKKYINAHTSD